MNGPGFWLIGISRICIGYSCVFSWAFVAGRVKFRKAPKIRSLLYIFYDGKGCHVWIFLSLFFWGEGTRIRNIGRQWKDLPELVAVMGFRQIYYILALPVAGKEPSQFLTWMRIRGFLELCKSVFKRLESHSPLSL